MLKKVGTDIDLDSISALSRKFEDTLIGISMREMADGLIKVSFRSMDDRIDVAKIASKFGGGGHKRASGCSFRIPMEDAKKQLLDGIEEECNNLFGGNGK